MAQALAAKSDKGNWATTMTPPPSYRLYLKDKFGVTDEKTVLDVYKMSCLIRSPKLQWWPSDAARLKKELGL